MFPKFNMTNLTKKFIFCIFFNWLSNKKQSSAPLLNPWWTLDITTTTSPNLVWLHSQYSIASILHQQNQSRPEFRGTRTLILTNEIFESLGKIVIYDGNKQFLHPTKCRQGNEQTRTFEPTNESADWWPATHSYNFIIRVK